MTDDPISDRRAAGEALWAELRALLRWLGCAFGDPAEVAARLRMPRDEGRLLGAWLAGLETLARALLAALARDFAPSLRAAHAGGPSPARRTQPEQPEDSERWTGVAFRFAPRDLPPERSRRSATGALRDFAVRGGVDARPLARRFEALIRVAERPEHYARRLARRFAGRPEDLPRLLRRPPLDRRAAPGDLIDEAEALAWVALRIEPAAPDSG
jgi:hypothetical protein